MAEMETCKHSEQMTALMSLSLDGLLNKDGQFRLERHLASCSVCQAEWKAMQQVSALFERSSMVGPPLGFALKVERRLEEKNKRRQRTFGGIAVLTSSLSLAGVTVGVVLLIVLGVLAWQWLGPLPSVQQGTSVLSQFASGMGLVGKGASFFLKDLLVRYGAPLVLLLAVGLVLLAGVWTWLFVKRPGNSHHNGYA
jgi:predicted anti-sigma-YlaC factor YlaD